MRHIVCQTIPTIYKLICIEECKRWKKYQSGQLCDISKGSSLLIFLTNPPPPSLSLRHSVVLLNLEQGQTKMLFGVVLYGGWLLSHTRTLDSPVCTRTWANWIRIKRDCVFSLILLSVCFLLVHRLSAFAIIFNHDSKPYAT